MVSVVREYTYEVNNKIRDVERESITHLELEPFIRRNNRTIKETLETQKRLHDKWEKQKNAVRVLPFQSYEETRSQQLEKLKNLVQHAYSTTNFYRELYNTVGYEPGCIVDWSDFENLPVINKKIIVDAGLSEEIRDNNKNVNLHSARTSGSSGLNLTIYQDDESVDYRHILYIRFCEMMLGRKLKENDLRYGIYFASERFSSLLGKYPFVTFSQETPVELIIKNLEILKPQLLLSFPSYLQRLYKTGICLSDIGVEAICTNSERSSLEERKRYAEAFGAPVFDEYSSEEFSLIACECKEGKYHLTEDSGYFELINKDPQGFGKLVGTSLGNYCMPFIRYDQGDLMKISPHEDLCSCGMHFRTIESFRGREDESLFDGPDRKIPSDEILGLCDYTLVELGSNVLQYQIIQKEWDEILLKLQPINKDLCVKNNHVFMFIEKLKDIFTNVSIRVNIEVTNEFDSYKSGKRKLIYSLVNK